MPLTISIADVDPDDREYLIPELRRVFPDVAEDGRIPVRVWWDLLATTTTVRPRDLLVSLRAISDPGVGRSIAIRSALLAARRTLHSPVLLWDGSLKAPDSAVWLTAIEAAEALVAEPSEERRTAALRAASAVERNEAVVCAVGAALTDTVEAAVDSAVLAGLHTYFRLSMAAAGHATESAINSGHADEATYRSSLAASTAGDAERGAQFADLDRLLAELETSCP